MDDLRRIEESRVARIIFDGVEEEGLLVTPLGANLYRLEETPIPLDRDFETADADLQLWRGDTIEAEVLESGALRYRTTAAKTPWRHFSWILASDVIDSGAFAAFTDVVERNRGIWERIMGGYFIVHLPEDSTFDPEAELAACVERSTQLPKN